MSITATPITDVSFPRAYRLIQKSEFKAVFDKSKKLNQKQFLILFAPNFKNHSRIGIIISKKVAKHAVVRNRFKRVIRESFRLQQHKFIGWDIVTIARTGCDKLTKEIFRKGIDELWEKLSLQYQNHSS